MVIGYWLMVNVLIALGSNYHQVAHIHWASQRLSCLLSDVRLSRILWTQDIHGSGVRYANRLIAGYTSLTVDELQQQLKAIEAESRRTQSRVTIDLDLMQYGDQRFHLQDWPRPYIQQLLGETITNKQ